MAATPDGKGYWMVASDGGIFAFGDAKFYGSMGSGTIVGWAVGITATPDGKGYYIQSSDGAVFAYGDAKDQGRLFYPPPAITMNASPTPAQAGSPLNFNWQVANGTGASVIFTGDGVVPQPYKVNDATTATPTTQGSSPYTLTVIGPGGTDSLQVVVVVNPPAPTVQISFTNGQPDTQHATFLTWNTTNVPGATITVSGGNVPIPGFSPSRNVGPSSPPSGVRIDPISKIGNYVFTITATNASGTVTATANLGVVGVTATCSSPATIYTSAGVVNTKCVSYTVNSGTMVCVDASYTGSARVDPSTYNSTLLAASLQLTPGVSPQNTSIKISNKSLLFGQNGNTFTYCINPGYTGSNNITNAVLSNPTTYINIPFTILDARLVTQGQSPDILLLP